MSGYDAAWAAGQEIGRNAARSQHARKQHLQDEKRHADVETYNQAIAKLGTAARQAEATYGKDSTQYSEAARALQNAVQSRTALFNPKGNPNAFEQLATMLRIHKPKKADPPGMSIEQAQKAAADPSQQETYNNWAAMYEKVTGQKPTQEMQQRYMEHAAGITVPKPMAMKAIGKPYKGTDGKWYQAVQDPADGTMSAQEMPEGFTPPPANMTSTAAKLRGYAATMGKKIEDMTDDDWTGYDTWDAQQRAGTTTSNYDVITTDDKGDQRKVPMTRTTSKSFPNAAKPAGTSAPTTPDSTKKPELKTASAKSGELKEKVKKTAPAKDPAKAKTAPLGPVVGHKNTPAQTDAQKQYDNSVALAKKGDLALEATDPVDKAAKQKVFVGSLQRTIEGRFNQGAYDNLSVKYGYGQRFEKWLNDFSAGELPEEVMKALVAGAHDDVTASQTRLDEAYGRGQSSKKQDVIVVSAKDME